MAQRVEYAVDEGQVRVVALGRTQLSLQLLRHVGSGQGPERTAHPGFAAEPLVAARGVAKCVQQVKPL